MEVEVVRVDTSLGIDAQLVPVLMGMASKATLIHSAEMTNRTKVGVREFLGTIKMLEGPARVATNTKFTEGAFSVMNVPEGGTIRDTRSHPRSTPTERTIAGPRTRLIPGAPTAEVALGTPSQTSGASTRNRAMVDIRAGENTTMGRETQREMTEGDRGILEVETQALESRGQQRRLMIQQGHEQVGPKESGMRLVRTILQVG